MTRRVAAQSRAMRPPPLLLLLLLGCGAAAPPTGWPSQLPAPKNVKLHLYNTQQVLSWDPVTPGEDPRPLVYQVQYRLASSHKTWSDVIRDNIPYVNCSNIMATKCDFTPFGFPMHFTVSLQVRAKQGELTSAWTRVPQFMPYQNATIGPPQNLKVMAGEGSLLLHLSPPFDVHRALVKLQYQVRYWEKGTDDIQTKGPLGNSSINLEDLKPLRVYCLQVRAQIEIHGILNSGLFQNASCYETKATATSRLQQTILIVVGTFLLLSVLMGTFLFLFLRYRGLLKYWFHTPPSIPLQIEEYLKEPNQPILEALDNSPKDDAWDSVSIISFPEKEQKEVFQSTLNQSTNEAHQPEEKGLSSR